MSISCDTFLCGLWLNAFYAYPVSSSFLIDSSRLVKDGTIRAGFIAQELQEAQKDCDYLDLVHDENPEKLEAKQSKLIPVLVKAIQELSAKVEELESRQ